MAFEIINPEAFGGRPSGWNHGMLAEKGGRILFVAGQIVPVGDFVAQWDGALGRVMEVVRSAGGKPENVGRMVIYVTDRPAYLANLTLVTCTASTWAATTRRWRWSKSNRSWIPTRWLKSKRSRCYEHSAICFQLSAVSRRCHHYAQPA
jgi:enamine deaminase RidA (YjgF/YER057c/UK114 family)